jgi:cobyrinic acid a,c-diamide synthase
LADKGLPIYAECGGLMYLGKMLKLNGAVYPMAGVLPIVFGFSKKPQGHGYTIVSVEKPNPFFKVGTRFKGHEFHYSKVLEWDGADDELVFKMERGTGLINGKDGVCRKNVLATYTHIHALGLPVWAKSMISNALAYKTGLPDASCMTTTA